MNGEFEYQLWIWETNRDRDSTGWPGMVWYGMAVAGREQKEYVKCCFLITISIIYRRIM